jgi:hypothetical protein
MSSSDLKRQLVSSVTGKVIGVTALLAATAGLVNGAMDVYKAIAKVPTNLYEKTNDELFKKHFGKQPVVSQPVDITASNLTVKMLLQVFDTGDVFVRYGDFQQWLPFKPLTTSSRSLVSEAFAQTSIPRPVPSSKGDSSLYGRRIIIDVDKLKREQAEQASHARQSKPEVIEKSYLLEKLKDDHPYLFSQSKATYTQEFKAEPGYKIVKYEFQLGSSNNHQIDDIRQIDDQIIRISFRLASGPVTDQWRGWVRGTIRTTQQRVP